jgi:hypothetical protein
MQDHDQFLALTRKAFVLLLWFVLVSQVLARSEGITWKSRTNIAAPRHASLLQRWASASAGSVCVLLYCPKEPSSIIERSVVHSDGVSFSSRSPWAWSTKQKALSRVRLVPINRFVPDFGFERLGCTHCRLICILRTPSILHVTVSVVSASPAPIVRFSERFQGFGGRFDQLACARHISSTIMCIQMSPFVSRTLGFASRCRNFRLFCACFLTFAILDPIRTIWLQLRY